MRRKSSWDPRKTVRRCAREARLLRASGARLTRVEERSMDAAIRRLDQKFLREKAELVRDTMLEILRHRKRTPNTLLQRNIWASLDAIALHLDHAGLTPVFKRVAPKMFRDTRLDSPHVVNFEWQLMRDFLGVNERQAAALGLPKTEIAEVLSYAEEHKAGRCGLPYIASRKFSFQESFRRFCGRPDKILEIHHSPQAKAAVAIITGVVNIITLFGLWGITVITVVVLIIIGCAGC
ncbi:MAG: hypothetical protein HYV08_17485 [Deltaproteobacteria bacterium]|nr:hypothetical protein [Deltaproteobacteria bacterium]